MSALDSLKALCTIVPQSGTDGTDKKYKSFSTLEKGEYLVTRFSKATTKMGERIRIDIGDTYMYLPERFNSMDEATMKELNLKPPMMIFNGREPGQNGRILLDFQDIDTFINSIRKK